MRLFHLFHSKIIILLLIEPCLLHTAFGQMIIGKIITDRQLLWTDFQQRADSASPYSASTNWSVNYRAHLDSVHTDTAFLSFRVTPVFNSYASWVKKEKIKRKKTSKQLLQHEQRHYDLAIICAETLKQTLEKTLFFNNNFSLKADSIADETVRLFTEIENKYDSETNHMLNQKAQKKWNRTILSLLAEVPGIYHNR